MKRRTAAAVAVLAAAAGLFGVARAQQPTPDVPRPAAKSGAELYAEGCIGCHGEDGRGVSGLGPAVAADDKQGAGPSLIGVGAQSAHFYLTTGYMPLDDPHEPPKRSDPEYTPEEIDALVDHVASLGGGPPIPDVDPERGSVAQGRQAFTEHCAGCHQVVAEGGVVLDGVAPALDRATPTQIAEAIRIGPYLMPAWGEAQIDDRTVDSIARYVQYAKRPQDEGGWGIGHIGPIPEGLAAWLVTVFVLVGLARVIGKRLA